MSSHSSWRPNLPESQLFDEKTWLQGAILLAVAYGVTLALFILIISQLNACLKVDIKHSGRASRLTICLLTYVCAMFILSTLGIASQAEMTQLSFIENRDYLGGPAAYEESMIWIPINSLGNCCSVLMNCFSNSLLLWRCSVIYRSSRTSVWLVMTVPGLMLLASFVTGIIFLEKISHPPFSPWGAFVFTLIYASITISVNSILTLMIVTRLYLHRRRFTKLLGRTHTAHYFSIISILIESQAVPIVVALWFLIPFAMSNRLANIPLSIMAQVQVVTSYMIIFRVAKGTAWTSRTADSELTIHGASEDVESISNIQFQTASIEHPADRPVISRSRNQFSLDGPRDVLDTESNSRGTICGISSSNPGGIEEAKPHVN